MNQELTLSTPYGVTTLAYKQHMYGARVKSCLVTLVTGKQLAARRPSSSVGVI